VLQLGAQRHQLTNPSVNILDVSAGDGVHLAAGMLPLLAERQQLTNVGDLEAKPRA